MKNAASEPPASTNRCLSRAAACRPGCFPFSERIRSRQTLLRAVRRVVSVVHQHQPGLGAVLVDGADPGSSHFSTAALPSPDIFTTNDAVLEKKCPSAVYTATSVLPPLISHAHTFAHANRGTMAVEILRGRLALKVRRGAVHDVARPVDPLGAEGFVYAYVCAHVERDASFERPVRRPHLGLVPVLHLFEGAVVQLEVVERIERGPLRPTRMTVSPFSSVSFMNRDSMLPSRLLCQASGNAYVVHDLVRGDTPVSGSVSNEPVRLFFCDTEMSGLARDFRYLGRG